MHLSNSEARAFLIQHHGLGQKSPSTKAAIMKLFDKLHCIQYDPLNVVGRNPDLVIQARIENYDPKIFHQLIYHDRQLIDGWDKMMAIYPIGDWPYFDVIRRCHGRGTKSTLAYRNSLDALDLTEGLLDLIEKGGPLQSSKLPSKSTNKGSWGHRKLTSAGLDYLYAVGKICVSDKINTQKIYDLTDRVVPKSVLDHPPVFPDTEKGLRDFIKWYIFRRIDTMGLLWNKNGGAWLGYYIEKKKDRLPYIEELIKEEKITPIYIGDIKEPFYITRDNLKDLKSSLTSKKRPDKSGSPNIRFLGPLDNFMWDRGLIEAVFNFKYRWEVYTPVDKREFGYYVLPILYGDSLVGRIEFDYYRQGQDLSIKNTWYEKNFTPDENFTKAFQEELMHFENYLKKI